MEFDREIVGRSARAEIRMYEGIHAEILANRSAEKLRHAENWKTRGVRNYRKPGKCGRKYWKFPNKGNVSNAEFRARKMAPMLEADWELELYAECVEDSIAEIREKTIVETDAETMRRMNEWLMWV